MPESLLSVNNLKTHFHTIEGVVKAVDGVTFQVDKGQTVGLVGESGCGKSTIALSVMRLVPDPGRIVEGNILFKGEDLLQRTESEMREVRGADIAMGFQDPMTYLNPVMRIGKQIAEAIIRHQSVEKEEANRRAIEAMQLLGIPSPEKIAMSFPHHLSGGMRQRVLISMALACRPDLLILDEPTTALDVVTQAQMLLLLKEIAKELNTATLLITHDLGLVAQLCDHIAVMYAGKIVENATVHQIMKDPKHPYTLGLLNSIPRMSVQRDRLDIIQGAVPDLLAPPSGCTFHPRCPYAVGACSQQEPKYTQIDDGRFIACFRWKEIQGA